MVTRVMEIRKPRFTGTEAKDLLAKKTRCWRGKTSQQNSQGGYVMEKEIMMDENSIETHPQTLVAIDQANVWIKGNDFIVEYLDFYIMVTLDTMIDLGLDAIQPDCLRMEWERLTFTKRYKRITDSEFLGEILDWMDECDREFQSL